MGDTLLEEKGNEAMESVEEFKRYSYTGKNLGRKEKTLPISEEGKDRRNLKKLLKQ